AKKIGKEISTLRREINSMQETLSTFSGSIPSSISDQINKDIRLREERLVVLDREKKALGDSYRLWEQLERSAIDASKSYEEWNSKGNEANRIMQRMLGFSDTNANVSESIKFLK